MITGTPAIKPFERQRRRQRRLPRLFAIAALAAGTAVAAPQPESGSPSAPAAAAQQGSDAGHAAATPSSSLEDVLRDQDPSDAWLSLALMGGAMLAVFVLRGRLR